MIWSIINLTPISVYCYSHLEIKFFYIFLAVSSIAVFLNNRFLDKIQIGKSVKIYKVLGVPYINRIAQNGVIINNYIKRKYPSHKIVSNKKDSISSLINQTYMFEKFHLILFLFFCFTFIYALAASNYIWAVIILFTNVAYNIYPNLLQQYIRIKLTLFKMKMPESVVENKVVNG